MFDIYILVLGYKTNAKRGKRESNLQGIQPVRVSKVVASLPVPMITEVCECVNGVRVNELADKRQAPGYCREPDSKYRFIIEVINT